MGVHEPGPSGMVLDLGRVILALHGARTGCDFRPKARVEKCGSERKSHEEDFTTTIIFPSQSSVGRFTSSPVLAWLAPECSCVVRILPGRVQLSFDIQIARNYPGKEKAVGRGEKRVGCLAQIQVPPSVINMIVWERSRLRLPLPPEGDVVVVVVVAVISAARR